MPQSSMTSQTGEPDPGQETLFAHGPDPDGLSYPPPPGFDINTMPLCTRTSKKDGRPCRNHQLYWSKEGQADPTNPKSCPSHMSAEEKVAGQEIRRREGIKPETPEQRRRRFAQRKRETKAPVAPSPVSPPPAPAPDAEHAHLRKNLHALALKVSHENGDEIAAIQFELNSVMGIRPGQRANASKDQLHKGIAHAEALLRPRDQAAPQHASPPGDRATRLRNAPGLPPETAAALAELAERLDTSEPPF